MVFEEGFFGLLILEGFAQKTITSSVSFDGGKGWPSQCAQIALIRLLGFLHLSLAI